MPRAIALVLPLLLAACGAAAADGAGIGAWTVLLCALAAAAGAGAATAATRYRHGGGARRPAPHRPPGAVEATHGDPTGMAAELRALRYCASAFAHDLKGPLNSMVLTVELLRLSAEQEGGDEAAGREKRRRYARSLGEEIRKLDTQLRVLLAHVAPAEAPNGGLDLGALLRDLRALITPQATRQRVVVRAEIHDGPRVGADAARVRQALLDVLVGALATMPAGGELAITVHDAPEAATVMIQDTGTLAPSEAYPHATRLLAASGGTLSVERRPGAGACVTLRLPKTAPVASR